MFPIIVTATIAKNAIISDTTVKMGNDFSAPVPPAPPDFKYFVVTIKKREHDMIIIL